MARRAALWMTTCSTRPCASLAKLNLPVQVHTGHMAGIRNRVDKANAAHFAPVLELHTRVQFDLFHGNWPYMGDILFLGKNYPNARLNLCWLPIIDPIYCQELIKRAVMVVPHNKIHGFGGDYWDAPEYSVAHLTIGREVIAAGPGGPGGDGLARGTRSPRPGSRLAVQQPQQLLSTWAGADKQIVAAPIGRFSVINRSLPGLPEPPPRFRPGLHRPPDQLGLRGPEPRQVARHRKTVIKEGGRAER